ncbi:hypothetical protein [Virgibacillus necropolis]|uniref:Uncharacterized protein n=1 Tax=Virgibacillus necropolis TaxID=163877 RepID=A0A221MGS6_9BACI|nr:hypothetical protein [Virgibacillus necropolis]ASN06841.1 hypothetical protein CFK40_18350 [Virgibacillus necropolis]
MEIELISVIIASAAAIASWGSVVLTRKQYKEQLKDRFKKFRPYFKIKYYNTSDTKQNYWFSLVNEGYPFFVISNARWIGESVIVKSQFNGLMVHSEYKGSTSKETDKYEALVIKIEVKAESNTEGFIEINGFDLENNDFSFKTPLILIENGEIINGEELTFQYLN